MGYLYFNNEYQKILNNGELDIGHTELSSVVYMKVKEFYLDVIQNIVNFKTIIYVDIGTNFYLMSDEEILYAESGLV